MSIINDPNENTRRFWPMPTPKGTRHDQNAAPSLYIVRKTTYGGWRVFNVVTKNWEGNAFEEERDAQALKRRLEKQ